MAVEHMVAFKFKPEISPERIDVHQQALWTLKNQVPDILNLQVGDNFSERAKGFHLGLIVTLTSREALKVYANHPAHVAVARPLIADCEDVFALDFERPD